MTSITSWNHSASVLHLGAFHDMGAKIGSFRCLNVVSVPEYLKGDMQGTIVASVLILQKGNSSSIFCSTLMTSIRKVTVQLTYHHTWAPCRKIYLFPFVQYPSFVF
jgi:hypothetical protein